MERNLYQLLHNSMSLVYTAKLKIALDVAEAMEFVHSRVIIHEDLSSNKILIDQIPQLVAKVVQYY